MSFEAHLVEQKVISQAGIDQAREIQDRGTLTMERRYRSTLNTLLLICAVDEDTLVRNYNTFNRNEEYVSTRAYRKNLDVYRVMTLEEQTNLETIVLEVNTTHRRITLGTISANEANLMRVRTLISKKLPSYAIEIKRILEIPYKEWLKHGHYLAGNLYEPVELEIAVDEKLRTVFRISIEERATDISIESSQHETLVYLTIDKERVQYKNVILTPEEARSITTWIITNSGIGQTLAEQKIVDCALPKLGNIETHRARVNKITTTFGVVINMRILPNNPEFIDLTTLNYSKFIHDYINYLTKPRKGLVLICGPTNSGKNTSIFAVISELLKKYKLKAISLEQPVEYLVPGVNQINAEDDDEYVNVARALVRQSPDIIYLAEIRDFATIEAALAISRTGKFVLSTMHISHAFDIFNRAGDLYGSDISSKMTSELIGVINQMLLPRACPDCLVEIKQTDLEIRYRKVLADQGYNGSIYDNTGKTPDGETCLNCKGEGYRGISPVAEYINFDSNLKRHLRQCKTPSEKEEMLQNEMVRKDNSILKDALRNLELRKVSISTLIEKSILDEDYVIEGS